MKAFIFDMDGVIIDSEKYYALAIQRVVNDYGHEVDQEYTNQFIGTTNTYTWTRIIKDFQIDSTPAELTEKMMAYKAQLDEEHGLIFYPGILGLLKRLKAHGFRLAIASSSGMKEIQQTVDVLDAQDYFDFLVSGEEINLSKPDPGIYLHTAKLLEMKPSQCIVIEDSHNGARAAKAAGMYCIGYIDTQYPAQDLSMVDQKIYHHDDLDLEQLIQTVYGE